MRGQATQQFARTLRRDMTDAERLLWYHLRNRSLIDLKFRRQSPVGPFVVDFLSIEAFLIVEIDGDQHTVQRDAGRSRFLQRRGFRMLRFWNHDVLVRTEQVLDTIHASLSERHPHLNPSRGA